MKQVLYLIGWTFIPALELRASIPIGIINYKMNITDVVVTCVLANIALGILFYFMLDTVMKLFRRMEWFERIYQKMLVRAQRKIQKFVDKWGELGIAIFIGIPLPGSGVITGALGSYAIGLKKRKFFIANVIGVLIAGTIVTIVTLTGNELFKKIFTRIMS